MKNLPFLFIFLASLFALGGMALGIYMGMSENHSGELVDAHAHNNLLGWVTMALFGLYYKAVPAAAVTRLAMIHFWVALVGAATFGIGVYLTASGITWIIQISSLLVIASMAIFAWTIWSNRGGLNAG